MDDPIVAVVGINGAFSCWYSCLSRYVVEQHLYKSFVFCQAIFLAVYLFWHEPIVAYHLEHSLAINNLVGGVEINLHQKNRSQFGH
jgi:hypothetical protein